MKTIILQGFLSEKQRLEKWNIKWTYIIEFFLHVLGGGGIEINWNAVYMIVSRF